jgi:hypothetical protein
VEYFRELHRLAVFMFFDGNNPANRHPAVVRTLSYRLVSFDPSIREAIFESIKQHWHSGVTEVPIPVQLIKLLFFFLFS